VFSRKTHSANNPYIIQSQNPPYGNTLMQQNPLDALFMAVNIEFHQRHKKETASIDAVSLCWMKLNSVL
jgi:hypothetical protein